MMEKLEQNGERKEKFGIVVVSTLCRIHDNLNRSAHAIAHFRVNGLNLNSVAIGGLFPSAKYVAKLSNSGDLFLTIGIAQEATVCSEARKLHPLFVLEASRSCPGKLPLYTTV